MKNSKIAVTLLSTTLLLGQVALLRGDFLATITNHSNSIGCLASLGAGIVCTYKMSTLAKPLADNAKQIETKTAARQQAQEELLRIIVELDYLTPSTELIEPSQWENTKADRLVRDYINLIQTGRHKEPAAATGDSIQKKLKRHLTSKERSQDLQNLAWTIMQQQTQQQLTQAKETVNLSWKALQKCEADLTTARKEKEKLKSPLLKYFCGALSAFIVFLSFSVRGTLQYFSSYSS